MIEKAILTEGAEGLAVACVHILHMWLGELWCGEMSHMICERQLPCKK